MKKPSNILLLFVLLGLAVSGMPAYGHGTGHQPESPFGEGQGASRQAAVQPSAELQTPKADESAPVKVKVENLLMRAKAIGIAVAETQAEAPEAVIQNGKADDQLAASENVFVGTQAGLKGIQKGKESNSLYFVAGFLLGFVGVLGAFLIRNGDRSAVKLSAIG